nr:uncharacterized protein LOC114920570 [Labrus bergylta]
MPHHQGQIPSRTESRTTQPDCKGKDVKFVGECVSAEQLRRGCWCGAAAGGLGSEVLDGKASSDQADRPAASTHVIAEPCVLNRAGAKALSAFLSSIPSHSREAWLSLPCFSQVQLLVFQAMHSAVSPCPSLHFHPCTSWLPLSEDRTSFAHENTSAFHKRPSTNSVTLMPTDGNFLWSCSVIGGETSKQRTAGLLVNGKDKLPL